MKTRSIISTVAVIALMIVSGCGTTAGTETAISSDRQEALEEISTEKDAVITAEAESEKQTTKSEENNNNEDGEKQSSQKKEKEADLSKIEYAKMIPDPKEYFPDAEITINDPDGGKMYAMQLTNYTKEEYDAYISECQTMGFDYIEYNVEYEGGADFGAYSTNGEYWVQVNLDDNNEVLYIVCNKSKHNPFEEENE